MAGKSFKIGVKFGLLALVALLSLPIVGLLQKRALDQAAREFSLSLTESVLAADDLQLLMESSTPELSGQMTESTWRSYLDSLRRLGPLQLIESISGTTDVPLLSFFSDGYSADHLIATEFANGAASVRVSLLHQQGRWWVSSFIVSSPLTND